MSKTSQRERSKAERKDKIYKAAKRGEWFPFPTGTKKEFDFHKKHFEIGRLT